MRKTSKITGLKTFNFSLPAIKTCPFAGECRKYCYASKGAFCYPMTKAKHQTNFIASLGDNFTYNMMDEIIMNQVEAVRIHDAGDFYSINYCNKWLTIAKALPHVIFYAYTKSIPYFKGVSLPENFVLIYSFGGRFDRLIDIKKDRHCKVFKDFIPSDYAYANDNDHISLAKNKRIGLLLH